MVFMDDLLKNDLTIRFEILHVYSLFVRIGSKLFFIILSCTICCVRGRVVSKPSAAVDCLPSFADNSLLLLLRFLDPTGT